MDRLSYDGAAFAFRNQEAKVALTTWLIDKRQFGDKCPHVISAIDLNTLPQPLPVHERANRMLKYLEKKSPVIGVPVECNIQNEGDLNFMEMLAWTESACIEELEYLSDYLIEQGWTAEDSKAIGWISLIITVEGYTRLAELATKHVNSSQGFVAMWFDDSMTEAYENGIGPGIEDAGYSPRRIDEKPHVNKIDDEIIAEIRRSRFVVADFTHGDTGHRGGVYYEAGFAHGLGIPVFFTCHKDVLDKIHFDTRQYNHILWETHAELRKALADKISAVIGDGPNKTLAAD